MWPPGTPPPSSAASVSGVGRNPKRRAFLAAAWRGAYPVTGSRGRRTDRRPTPPPVPAGDEAAAAAAFGAVAEPEKIYKEGQTTSIYIVI